MLSRFANVEENVGAASGTLNVKLTELDAAEL
jgi:hypothetical protein